MEFNVRIREFKKENFVLEKTNKDYISNIEALLRSNTKLENAILKSQITAATSPVQLMQNENRDLTPSEKGLLTKQKNKRIADLNLSFHSFVHRFTEVKRRYQRLHHSEQGPVRFRQSNHTFEEAKGEYKAFLLNLETGWNTPTTVELREQADEELIVQNNFLKALQSKYEIEEESQLSQDTVSAKQTLNLFSQAHEPFSNPYSESKPETHDNKDIKMAKSITQMLKAINSTIPEYAGCSGRNSQQELGRFIDCCEILYAAYRDNDANKQQFMTLIKSRFKGDAYDLVNRSSYTTFDELKKILFKTYICHPAVWLKSQKRFNDAFKGNLKQQRSTAAD